MRRWSRLDRAAARALGPRPYTRGPPLVESEPIREELQTAFAQGRREILSLDFYRAAYPFWRYNSVLDDRTTEGCRELNGLVLPAKDPALGRVHAAAALALPGAPGRDHAQRGVKAPKRKPIEQYAGEGTFATLNEEWEPRPENYPPDLWRSTSRPRASSRRISS